MSARGSWTETSLQLARRIERRERTGALLSAAGTGAFVGGAVALAAGWTGAALPLASAVVAAGLAVGVWAGVRRARAVPSVDPRDAAWALDRLAGAGEAGLAESVGGAAAHTPPPPVRMQPLRGLSRAVGGTLVAGLALALPLRAAPAPDDPADAARSEEGALRSVGQVDAPTQLARHETQAAEAARVRIALGLPPQGEVGAGAVAEALREDAVRRAALEAATPAGALAEALAGSPDAAADIARGLSAGARAAEGVEAARRADVALAWARADVHIPPARRALVERYMARVRASEAR